MVAVAQEVERVVHRPEDWRLCVNVSLLLMSRLAPVCNMCEWVNVTCSVKELWVVKKTRKVLYKYNPFTIQWIEQFLKLVIHILHNHVDSVTVEYKHKASVSTLSIFGPIFLYLDKRKEIYDNLIYVAREVRIVVHQSEDRRFNSRLDLSLRKILNPKLLPMADPMVYECVWMCKNG